MSELIEASKDESFEAHKDLVKNLESDYKTFLTLIQDPEYARLLHASLGMVTEAGEFADALKRLYYGKPIDKVNLVEELGDILWYVTLAMIVLEVDYKTVVEKNIRKLLKRFPEGQFAQAHALIRDLAAERVELEQ